MDSTIFRSPAMIVENVNSTTVSTANEWRRIGSPMYRIEQNYIIQLRKVRMHRGFFQFPTRVSV